MKLIEVSSRNTIRAFLDVPKLIYKNDKNWISHLDQDMEGVFDPEKNKLLNNGGQIIRWVLQNDKEKYIGRIAAFIHPKISHTTEYVHGGVGFFECTNDKEAAKMLFDAGKNWLSSKGMEAMDGPVNFGERNQWWGCLVEGFTPPTYQMNYNPPYYRELFESYGFQTYFNQFVFNYAVEKEVPERFKEKANRIAQSSAFHFEHIKRKQLKKYAEDFRIIYNASWAKMEHHKDLTSEQAYSIFRKMKQMMDEKIIWFGYFRDKPIAFFIMLPDINQVFKRVGSNFNWWGKLKFLYYKKTTVVDRMIGLVFGVTPEFQGKGIEGAIIIAAAKVVQPQKCYKNLEMNWVGDFNPKMIRMVENLGTTVVKRYITYRKIFDPDKPFFRAKMLD